MALTIIIFGQLTDITGTGDLSLESRPDTNSVIEELNRQFPALASMNYRLSVDKQIITTNTTLNSNSTIALLPPFSGG